ncbi:MAG: ParB/RepB/Spo0J family partition protein [Ruminococcaceae bacterium]|nr:ParB/RepB/Spo0J family partition protein [Oscillospiraceae bacterium]
MSSIVPNFKNPYKCREEDMKPLEDSIRENGIIQPLMVRKDDKANVYEIISGHRRFLAATRLKLTEVPVVILDISKEEADIILVDSNLHREHILPSEKAFAYKMKMDAIKRQGKRTDLTSDQVGPKLSAGEVSDTDSASQVKRYIRLTNLIPRLLALVDSGKIALGPAVELSYLSQGHQNFLSEAIEKELATPSLAQAQKLKKLEQEGKLDVGTILSMVKQPKPNQVVTVKIPEDKISKYMKSNATVKEKEDFLAKAVEYYGKHLQRQKDRGAR